MLEAGKMKKQAPALPGKDPSGYSNFFLQLLFTK